MHDINRVGKARARVGAELDLQRNNRNPPLQPAPTEARKLTVAEGPVPSGLSANVIPRQVAIEEDANQPTTVGESPTRKRLCEFLKEKNAVTGPSCKRSS